MKYARVALDVPLRREFSYSIPAAFAGDLLGFRVGVRFAKRFVAGVVAGVSNSPPPGRAASPLEAVLDSGPVFDPGELDFLVRAAEHFFLPVGQLIHAALPAALRKPRPFGPALAYSLTVERPTLGILDKGEGRTLELFSERTRISAAEFARLTRTRQTNVRSLAAKGVLRASVDPGSPFGDGDDAWRPGREKRRKLRKIAGEIADAARGFATHVVCVQPCAERTELCLQLLGKNAGGGRQALVLAHDARRADMLARRIAGALPGLRVGVLHPQAKPRSLANAWLAAAHGGLDILLGTRAAALAPLPGLSLAIVDESHAASFMQEERPRYSAVEMLRRRCRERGAKLVLCSATPALEDCRNIFSRGGAALAHDLAGIAFPSSARVAVCDSRGSQNFHGLAAPVVAKIKRRVGRGGRAAVLVAGRGWASRRYCAKCGAAAACPKCRLPLMVAVAGARLECPLCGFARAPAAMCGECAGGRMRNGREGAGQVEAGLRKAMPAARFWAAQSGDDPAGFDVAVVSRMDADIICGMEPGLVVVASVDARLMSFNYRATEILCADLFDLAHMCAAAGNPPELVVQTRHADHPLLRALAANDARGYWLRLLGEREEAGLPPHAALGAVRASGKRSKAVVEALSQTRDRLAAALGGSNSDAKALGIVDSGLRPRLGVCRMHFAVRAPDSGTLRRALALAERQSGEGGGGVRLEYDLCPWRL